MNFVYGPIPSRRLGQSLGIDLVPFKTCNWNCVYCQLGRSVPLTNQRQAYVPREDVLAEIQHVLDTSASGEIDWITFAGSGEPTLHSDIGWLIRQVKMLTNCPVAVITNGSLLHLSEVRHELAAADAVMPTLNAGNVSMYRRICRPWAILTFDRLREGLIAFRRKYDGLLWVEVVLIKGLNDSTEELQSLATVLQQIKPDQIHINLPLRPPSEAWVQPPNKDALQQAIAILGDVAHVIPPTTESLHLVDKTSVVKTIIDVIKRHPMCEDELIYSLGQCSLEQIEQTLEALAESGQAQVVNRDGSRFWSASAAHYPEHTNYV